MTARYVISRIAFFVAIVWATATLNFIIPRLAPGNPIDATLARMSATGQSTANADQIIAVYKHALGLDQSVFVQYYR
jgi:peptide/nickel transport system permease protein